MTLVAQCSNCAFWRATPDHGHATAANVGHCSEGRFPDEGDVLCKQYQASKAFAQQIISTMLKEQGPMALPVKLVGGRKSAREMNKRLAKKHGRK